MDLFSRCFLQKEMEAFLALLTPENTAQRIVVFDLLKRLASFKGDLKRSFEEGRLDLFDFILIDLEIGRLVFLFANDLTNHHFADVSAHNLRDALALVRELLNIMNIKGVGLREGDVRLPDAKEVREASALDEVSMARNLQTIAEEMQRYLRVNIIGKMGQVLNRVIESYQVPTARLSPVKTRFFNNFLRRTQYHVVSEFVDKVLSTLERGLSNQIEGVEFDAEFPDHVPLENPQDLAAHVARTWEETSPRLRSVLGGKGKGLVDMTQLGLRVPPAFILGLPVSEWCQTRGIRDGAFRQLIDEQIAGLEARCEQRFGDPHNPLLVSVRSGAAISMPGAMATILNTGMTTGIRDAIARKHGTLFALTLYNRFLKNCMAARELPMPLAGALGVDETRLRVENAHMATVLGKVLGPAFLSDPREQLYTAIGLVFSSIDSPTARAYLQRFSDEVHPRTAVTVQKMVFGNRNSRCLSGVVLTRNPVTGRNQLFGEFKEQVQGEDVVMGNVITRPIQALGRGLRRELQECKRRLEMRFNNALDIEFTVEDGVLYLLQVRRARIGAYAKLISDIDFLRRGMISFERFRGRLDGLGMAHDFITIPRTDLAIREFNPPISEGVPINGGIVSGALLLSSEGIEKAEKKRETIIYFAYNTKPTDFQIMNSAHAIVNVYPGRTSHAAITAMTLNKPCIVGCTNAEIDRAGRQVVFVGNPTVTIHEGEQVTIDANTGAVYRGPAPLSDRFLRVSWLVGQIEGIQDPDEAMRIVMRRVREKVAGLRRETGFQRRTLSAVRPGALKDRNVLLRLDLNVPVGPAGVLDTLRLQEAVPTIRKILEAGGTPVVCSHLGDPGAEGSAGQSREEIYAAFSLRPVAERLARVLSGDVVFHERSIASSGLLIGRAQLVPGKVNVLENLRFASGEKENDDLFARSLAHLADNYFVNDAFNVCHRRHASITGVPRFVRHSLAGPLVARELEVLERILHEPRPPFVAVLGGNRLSRRMGIVHSLLLRVDHLLLAGGVAHIFQEAAEPSGGPTPVDRSVIENARSLLSRYGGRIVLPTDVVRSGAGRGTADDMVVDLGEESLGNMLSHLAGAGTILWSGPLGVVERPDGAMATRVLARALADRADHGTVVVACGETTSAVIRQIGLASRFTHVSTGGAAFLEFIERLSLPGITALDPE